MQADHVIFAKLIREELVFALVRPSVHINEGTPVVAFSQTELSGLLNVFYLD